MHIKKQKDTSLPERQIVTALIISDTFINTISQILDTSLFQSKFTRIVADWCLEYHAQYEASPKGVIQDIFNSRKRSLDEVMSEAIATFLESISNEYDRNENFNYRYVLDQAQEYLRFRKLKSLADDINADITSNDLNSAEANVVDFNQIRLPETQGIDLFRDLDRVKEVLQNRDLDVVFKFKGVLGEVMNENCRGELIAFSGPEKRGKSWWLIEIGMLSVLDGFNVAHFSLEMLESQMITRQLQYLTGQPVHKKDVGCSIPYRQRNFTKYKDSTKPLLEPSKATRKLKSLWPMIRGASLRLICWPPSSKSILDIKNQLDLWEQYDNWVPDLIVVDHADRLISKETRQEKRHQIDSIWEDLKSLALERYCLVATATHTTKEAHTKKITKGSATAEDKRKAGHVDRMIGLNQSVEEKAKGYMRLNTLFERNADDRSNIDVTVLQQLGIGKPYLDSFIDIEEKD